MTLRGAPVLVSGGTGFLGSHLVRRLSRLGARVHLLTRQGSSLTRLVGVQPAPALTRVDFNDVPALKACIKNARPAFVFTAAGSTSSRGTGDAARRTETDQSYQANVVSVANLIEALSMEAPSSRVVRLGSIAEYGVGPLPFRETQIEQPASPYAESLVAATRLGQAAYRETGLAVTTLRIGVTYGPSQSESFLIPSLITACLDGKAFELANPTHTRDFIFVEDVVDAVLAAAVSDDLAGEVVNIGSGVETVIADVAAEIVRLTGAAINLRSSTGGARSSDVPRLVLDIARARKLLGWEPTTPLEHGLERTIAAYRASRMP
jgi:nucleoside-diphosphate-sugar epimerase